MVLFSIISDMRDDYLYGAIAKGGTLKDHTAETLAEKYGISVSEAQDIINEYEWTAIRNKIWGNKV